MQPAPLSLGDLGYVQRRRGGRFGIMGRGKQTVWQGCISYCFEMQFVVVLLLHHHILFVGSSGSTQRNHLEQDNELDPPCLVNFCWSIKTATAAAAAALNSPPCPPPPSSPFKHPATKIYVAKYFPAFLPWYLLFAINMHLIYTLLDSCWIFAHGNM